MSRKVNQNDAEAYHTYSNDIMCLGFSDVNERCCLLHVGSIGWVSSCLGMLGCMYSAGLELQILRGTQVQGHSRRAPKATVLKNTIEV